MLCNQSFSYFWFMLLYITSFIGLVLVIFLAIIFNRFVSNRNHVKDAWSNIEVFLKKRYELVPSLVKTAKGYAQHENNTLGKIPDLE
jgi:LemA protein